MGRKTHGWLLCCLLGLLLSNCIDSYEVHLDGAGEGYLVVEGNIISDSAVVFSLTRTFSLNEAALPEGYNRVKADVRVVGSDGTRWNGVELGDGEYQVEIGTLNKEVGYSLEIIYDGDTYISEPQTPLETSAIEEMTFSQPEEGGDIYINLSVNSKSTTGTEFYWWTYEEDWELRSVYYCRYVYEIELDEVIVYDKPPYSQGWCHSKSNKILIGSTESNDNNLLKNKRIYAIASDDHRVSYYYSTLITQRNLSKGEYEYYQCRKKLSDEMGGLFTPQPSELPTNIVCGDPDKTVIGYIGCNMNVSRNRIYVSAKDIQYTYQADCREREVSNVYRNNYLLGYQIFFYSAELAITKWANRECVDVRVWGGTLNKPDFWPLPDRIYN